jgi:hypothetical protein
MRDRNPPTVTLSRNPGHGKPWAVCWAAPNTFIFRLFEDYPDALAAARAIAVAKLEGDQDFSIAIARLPYDVPATSAIEASIDLADALLAAALSGKKR